MNDVAALVSALCDDALARLSPGPAHERITAARQRLDDPLRVAVAGSVNAGKSTLVNALLGERVAPTEQGECTQVVTWFRQGWPPDAEIVFRDGRRPPQPLPLTEEERLPRSIGVDPDTVEFIAIKRSNDVLERFTLIDTPGLDSANAHISARTERMFDPTVGGATAQADALIYVMTQIARADDRNAIRAFRSQYPTAVGSAANAVGILNKADKGGGPRSERLRVAAGTAQKYASELGDLVTDVIPMVGLLAESAERLDEDDAAALRALATLDPGARELMLDDPDDVRAAEAAGVPEHRYRRLWDLLDAFGLERCLGWIDEGAYGASDLRARLAETSGIETLRRVIAETFDQRSGALRAETAMRELESVAYAPESANAEALSWLRRALDDLRLEPAWHRLSELRAMREAAAADARLPEEFLEDLRRLVTAQTPAARLGVRANASVPAREQAALQGAARWRRATADWLDDDPALARIGRIVERSYAVALEELRNAQRGAS